ncbi:MAG: hypothetical protein FJ102_26580 [Deltaproteobacteria bacterium]|nr:hypothetical protein [Deltaproteobacteria bacterium]
MSVTVASIRQQVAAAIDSDLSASGWREATGTVDTFGEGDGEGRLHLGYAVGCPETVATGDRQKVSLGTLVDTTVRVRWAYRVGALRQVADYDAALEAEASLIKAVATTRDGTGRHVLWLSASRVVDDQGWMLGDLAFRAQHRLALA